MIHRLIIGIAAFGAGLVLAPEKLPAIEDIQHSGDGQYIGSIDVSAFHSGIYSFRIKHGEQVQSESLRVMR